jgi:uncharacterized protein YjbI with pentapeptide repeats
MRLPDDLRARQVLQEYLSHYERGIVPSALEATDLDLRGAVLDGLELQAAELYGACLDGVSLRHADLAGARLWSASLRGADLTGAEIVKAEFYGADARGATFDELVYAGRAEFDDARLRGARFRNANLSEVSFSDADLTEADFTGAILFQNDFLRARLHGATFEHANGTILDRGAYIEDRADAPLVSADQLVRWMVERGASEMKVFPSVPWRSDRRPQP